MVTGQLDPQIAEAEKKRELLKGKILGIASKRDQAAKWGEDEERDRLNKELLKLEQEEKGNQARITALKKERADKLEEEAKFIEENVKKLKAGTLHDQPAESGGDGSLTPGAFNRGEDRWDRAARAAGRGAGSSQFDALFVKYGKEYGVDPKLLKAIAMKESTLDPNAVGSLNDNGTRDYGLMQHNSRYLASRGITDWSDPEQSIRAAAKFLRQNIDASHGNVRRGVRMYNGSGPRAEAYADDVMGRYANVGEVEQKGTPLPEGPASPRPGETQMQQRISVEGTFHLHNPNGSPAAAPISVRTRLGPPAPSGAGG
ncbi:transglycosylase SLT domain-containing protein [Cupriavidus necator]|nr:transglycosylase SLT domain-containing protein [Cupriavidus necator]